MSEAVYKVTKIQGNKLSYRRKNSCKTEHKRRQRIDPIMPTPHEELLSSIEYALVFNSNHFPRLQQQC